MTTVAAADPTQASAAAGDKSAGSSPPPAGTPGFQISSMPMWAIQSLGSLLYLAVPFYRRALKVEGAVEGMVETVAEDVVKVATVVEKVASQMAEALPEDSIVENDFVLVEHWAEIVAQAATKAEALAHKVDDITKQIDKRVEPIISELEAMQIASGPGIAI